MQRRITSFFGPPRAADGGAAPAPARQQGQGPPRAPSPSSEPSAEPPRDPPEEPEPLERGDPDGRGPPSPGTPGPTPPQPPGSPQCPPAPGDEDGAPPPPPPKRCRQDRGPPAASSPPPLDPSQYDPARSGYHPLRDACWGPGQSVPYLAVARTFERIEEASARLKIVETLSNFLRSVLALSPGELLPCLRLCLNRPGAAAEGLELGVGESLLTRALAQATGRQLAQIRGEAQAKGDLGLVAESSRCTQRTVVAPARLSAAGVLGKLREMAATSGNASASKKIAIIKGLFVACRHSEARYLVRSLSGKLRIGLAEQSVLTALAHAVALTPPGQGWPPAVLDAGQDMAPEARRAWLEEQSRILKQTFW